MYHILRSIFLFRPTVIFVCMYSYQYTRRYLHLYAYINDTHIESINPIFETMIITNNMQPQNLLLL